MYTITGPSYPKGYSFHFRGVAFGDSRPVSQPEQGVKITLTPGQTLDSSLPLEQLVRFPQPGIHRLVASLQVDGSKATSGPVEFVIEATVIHSLQLLADDGAQTSSPIRVLCLVGDPPGHRLYQAILREERPDLGEVSCRS